MPDDRCGHTAQLSGIERAGAVVCSRPTWGDTDRCIWHTSEEVPTEEYEAQELEPGERLDGADLQGADLSGTDVLAGCSLIEADFTDAVLEHADLSDTDLRRATFRDVDARAASFARANLHDAVFIFVDLRGANFEDARLYRAGLTDVRINLATTFGDRAVYEAEFDAERTEGSLTDRSDAAEWVYRELQRLYDENAFPSMVRANYLQEMDLRRRRAWRLGEHMQAGKLAGSRWVTNYGTSPWRVIATSFLLILACALLYPLTGGIREVRGDALITYQVTDPAGTPVGVLATAFLKSLYFSVVTFATLGYGDIQPVGRWARAIAGIESMLGALLMALLVFVLTRSIR